MPHSIDTIGAFSAGGSMSDSANTVSMEQLLSQQLHGLIDFTTVLTRRLLLLEQKVQQMYLLTEDLRYNYHHFYRDCWRN